MFQVFCDTVIKRLSQGRQIPISHVTVKGIRLWVPGFFQHGQDAAEGGQTGSLGLTEGGQLEFGGVGDSLRHMEQVGDLLAGICTELGILWAALFSCNLHQINQSRLKLCSTL